MTSDVTAVRYNVWVRKLLHHAVHTPQNAVLSVQIEYVGISASRAETLQKAEKQKGPESAVSAVPIYKRRKKNVYAKPQPHHGDVVSNRSSHSRIGSLTPEIAKSLARPNFFDKFEFCVLRICVYLVYNIYN